MSPMSVYLDAALRANASFHPSRPRPRRPRLDVDPVHRRAGGFFAACLCAGFAVARAGDIEEWIPPRRRRSRRRAPLATLDGATATSASEPTARASPNSSSRSAAALRRPRPPRRLGADATDRAHGPERAPSPSGSRLDRRHPFAPATALITAALNPVPPASSPAGGAPVSASPTPVDDIDESTRK